MAWIRIQKGKGDSPYSEGYHGEIHGHLMSEMSDEFVNELYDTFLSYMFEEEKFLNEMRKDADEQ